MGRPAGRSRRIAVSPSRRTEPLQGCSHVMEHVTNLSNVKMISFLAKVEWIEMQGCDPSGLG